MVAPASGHRTTTVSSERSRSAAATDSTTSRWSDATATRADPRLRLRKARTGTTDHHFLNPRTTPSTARPSSDPVPPSVSAGESTRLGQQAEITAIDDGIGGDRPHTDLVISGEVNGLFGSFRTLDRVHNVFSDPLWTANFPGFLGLAQRAGS